MTDFYENNRQELKGGKKDDYLSGPTAMHSEISIKGKGHVHGHRYGHRHGVIGRRSKNELQMDDIGSVMSLFLRFSTLW